MQVERTLSGVSGGRVSNAWEPARDLGQPWETAANTGYLLWEKDFGRLGRGPRWISLLVG